MVNLAKEDGERKGKGENDFAFLTSWYFTSQEDETKIWVLSRDLRLKKTRMQNVPHSVAPIL